MPVENQTCFNCLYWLPYKEWKEKLGTGECHRSNPIPIQLGFADKMCAEGDEVEHYIHQALWPDTLDDDWCGEWQHKDKKKEGLNT